MLKKLNLPQAFNRLGAGFVWPAQIATGFFRQDIISFFSFYYHRLFNIGIDPSSATASVRMTNEQTNPPLPRPSGKLTERDSSLRLRMTAGDGMTTYNSVYLVCRPFDFSTGYFLAFLSIFLSVASARSIPKSLAIINK